MARLSIRSLGPIEEPTINLTPLIDVVFVVLIMFILVAPLLELDKINLAEAPSKEVVSVSEKSPITIHVYSDNRIVINKTPLSIKDLEAALRTEILTYPHARPQVFHDRDALFGTYQSVKNAIEAAGFEAMDIILKPS